MHFKQGYLNSQKERVVRVRIEGDRGQAHDQGRDHRRHPLGVRVPHPRRGRRAPARQPCEQPLIDKHRHKEVHGGKTWEIDVFHGDNEGLVVAEIELQSEDETVRASRLGGPRSLQRSALLQLEPAEEPLQELGKGLREPAHDRSRCHPGRRQNQKLMELLDMDKMTLPPRRGRRRAPPSAGCATSGFPAASLLFLLILYLPPGAGPERLGAGGRGLLRAGAGLVGDRAVPHLRHLAGADVPAAGDAHVGDPRRSWTCWAWR